MESNPSRKVYALNYIIYVLSYFPSFHFKPLLRLVAATYGGTKMRHTACLITLLSMLTFDGCVTTTTQVLETSNPTFPTDRNYEANFDTVWIATLKAINYFPITIIEKDSGIVQTDWVQYQDSLKVKVFRGLLFGGTVEDTMPMEVMHRLNIQVSRKENSPTNVKIIRHVKIRPYLQIQGPAGSWSPNTLGTFEPTLSNTQPENEILNDIENLLRYEK